MYVRSPNHLARGRKHTRTLYFEWTAHIVRTPIHLGRGRKGALVVRYWKFVGKNPHLPREGTETNCDIAQNWPRLSKKNHSPREGTETEVDFLMLVPLFFVRNPGHLKRVRKLFFGERKNESICKTPQSPREGTETYHFWWFLFQLLL